MESKIVSIIKKFAYKVNASIHLACDGHLLVVDFLRMHFEFTLKKPQRSLYTMTRYELHQKYLGDLKVTNDEIILDIGCGSYPLPLATIVADRYLDSDVHRPFGKLVTLGKPLVECDIGLMPFKSKSIDFVYCSNVLEHVDDPISACREIQRIGKKGYIQTPYRIADVLHNYLFLHRWSVSHSGDTLIFVEYEDWEKKGTDSDIFFQQGTSHNENYYRWWAHKNYNYLYNNFFWQNAFNCIVIRKDGSVETLIPEKCNEIF
jgi:Methylase involved in ubiquinone/menaquinone biosynthesis